MNKWVDIKGYEGLYKINRQGQIKRLKGYQASEDRLITPIDNGRGYLGVGLCKNGKKKRVYIHRLMAETFISNPDNKKQVNHINGIKSDNRLENLEWATRSENQRHMYEILGYKGANTGRFGSLSALSKKVIQMDLNGNVLNRFNAVMEAQRLTGINESNIRTCIYGKSKTAGGFKWAYI
jgi:hypothetical protein